MTGLVYRCQRCDDLHVESNDLVRIHTCVHDGGMGCARLIGTTTPPRTEAA